MIVLFTDYGWQGPYVGQLKGVLAREAPGVAVVDLMHDAPAFDSRAAAYLLPHLTAPFSGGAVFCCVVDPGVGSARKALALKADGDWFVAPDNGLLQRVAQQAKDVSWYEIVWRPAQLSSSFHGRDLFAPVAARLALGNWDDGLLRPFTPVSEPWPEALYQVIYIDGFGNVMSGVPAEGIDRASRFMVNGRELRWANTFCDVPAGQPFWYRNALGLVEFAVNHSRGCDVLGMGLGDGFAQTV